MSDAAERGGHDVRRSGLRLAAGGVIALLLGAFLAVIAPLLVVLGTDSSAIALLPVGAGAAVLAWWCWCFLEGDRYTVSLAVHRVLRAALALLTGCLLVHLLRQVAGTAWFAMVFRQ